MRDAPRKDGSRDPLSSHPVGTGAGAVAGAAAGAAAGTAVGGPAGTIVGGVIGAVAGGLAGRGIAEMVDPDVEDRYWREAHRNEPYYVEGREWDNYAPAYRAGYEGRVKYDGRTFDDVEPDLAADYERFRGNDMTWEEVRPASRAAWDRIDQRVRSATRN